MTTLSDLYRRVLEDLQVTAANESAPIEDTQFVATKYAQLYQMLKGESLIVWSITDDLPEDVVIPLTAMLKFLCAPGFGKPANPQEGALNLPGRAGGPSLAEIQLRRVLARDYVSSIAHSDYF